MLFVMIRYIIKGQVQGVNFRAITKRHADRLGLCGFVRNLPDNSVEICVIGTEEEADILLEKLAKEPPPIQISSIATSQVSSDIDVSSFEIL